MWQPIRRSPRSKLNFSVVYCDLFSSLLTERALYLHIMHIYSPAVNYCYFCTSQGYSGKGFECDFEEAGMCGWTDQSLNAAVYSWERRQRGGDTLPDSGPSSDYTTGTATGMLYFYLVLSICPHFVWTTGVLKSISIKHFKFRNKWIQLLLVEYISTIKVADCIVITEWDYCSQEGDKCMLMVWMSL